MAFGQGLSIGNILTAVIVMIVILAFLSAGIQRYDGPAFSANIIGQANTMQSNYISKTFNPINATLTGNSTGFNTPLSGGVFSAFAFVVNGFGIIVGAITNSLYITSQLTSTVLAVVGIPLSVATILPPLIITFLVTYVLVYFMFTWMKAGSWN